MKTKTQISFAVAAKLISAFVFATYKVQSLYFLYTKFQDFSHLVWLYSLQFMSDLVRNQEARFSHNEAHMSLVVRKPVFAYAKTKTQIIILLMLFLKARVKNRHRIVVMLFFVFALQSKQFRPGPDGSRCGD